MNGSFIAGVLRDLAASTAAILAAWGALGGATNALSTRMRLRDAIRHILLGGLIAAGMGSLSMSAHHPLAEAAARGRAGRRGGGIGRLSRRRLRPRGDRGHAGARIRSVRSRPEDGPDA